MVGADTKIIAFQSVRKLLGAAYKLGGEDPAEGIDCCSMVAIVARECGIDIPDKESYKNRASLWNENKVSAMQTFIKSLHKIAKEIPVNSAFVGDILICQDNQGNYIVGIHGGNATMITVAENSGCQAVSLDGVKVRKALRWAQQ